MIDVKKMAARKKDRIEEFNSHPEQIVEATNSRPYNIYRCIMLEERERESVCV